MILGGPDIYFSAMLSTQMHIQKSFIRMYMASNLWQTHTGSNYPIRVEMLKILFYEDETIRTTYKIRDEFYWIRQGRYKNYKIYTISCIFLK